VIAPPTADPEIAARIPFPAKAQALHQRDRGSVVRLNVRLDAVQPQRTEREAQYCPQRLAHVALAGERRTDVVAQVRAAKFPGDDLTELDGAEHGAIGVPENEPALVLGMAIVAQQGAEGGGLSRR